MREQMQSVQASLRRELPRRSSEMEAGARASPPSVRGCWSSCASNARRRRRCAPAPTSCAPASRRRWPRIRTRRSSSSTFTHLEKERQLYVGEMAGERELQARLDAAKTATAAAEHGGGGWRRSARRTSCSRRRTRPRSGGDHDAQRRWRQRDARGGRSPAERRKAALDPSERARPLGSGAGEGAAGGEARRAPRRSGWRRDSTRSSTRRRCSTSGSTRRARCIARSSTGCDSTTRGPLRDYEGGARRHRDIGRRRKLGRRAASASASAGKGGPRREEQVT